MNAPDFEDECTRSMEQGPADHDARGPPEQMIIMYTSPCASSTGHMLALPRFTVVSTGWHVDGGSPRATSLNGWVHGNAVGHRRQLDRRRHRGCSGTFRSMDIREGDEKA